MSTIGIDIRNIGKKRTGDEVVFFNLTKNLAKIDSVDSYKLFTDITDEKTLEQIRKDLEIEHVSNFEIVSLKTANKFSWNFWTLPMYIRKNPMDIYLTQYITPFFVGRKTKIATIIHDVSFVAYKQFIKWSDLFFLNLLIPLSLKRADKVIAVSKFTRLEINKYYKTNLEKIDWIYNAVSDDFLKQDISPEKQEEVRRKYNLPEKYILYIGTLQPRKNIPTLIETFAALKVEPLTKPKTTSRFSLEDVKLVVAGGKNHNFDEEIEKTIEKLNLKDQVIFPGFIDEEDKAALMKSAEVFCFPSFYEGFGIPILEAMSVGTPTVVSNIGPHKEIADEATLYFDPNDSQELAKKILEVINNETTKQDLITKGLERAKNFSWAKTAQKMLEIFKGV